MKKMIAFAYGALAFGLLAAPIGVRADDAVVDLPGPIDSPDDLQDTAKMLFKLADQNNDNRISQKEAVDAGNILVGGFFFNADTNGDSVLSKDEAKQARDAFLSTKPWLRYAIDTAKTTKARQGGTATQAPNPLKSLAAAFDSNNDKQLQAAELRQAVQTSVQGAFATADTNRDGQLTPAELNASMVGIARQVADAAFQQADTDNNGQISQAEFEKAIVEPSRVAFNFLDLNHDGEISREESQTARRALMSQISRMRVPEPSNSPRHMINSALSSPTRANPAPTPAPPSAPTQPR